MLYTLEERLSIGRQIYDGQLTRQTAAEKYGISHWTAKDYCKLYRDTYKLPPRKTGPKSYIPPQMKQETIAQPKGLEDYESMTKEELIQELILSKINEARAKKGYEVKGVGAAKEFIPLDRKSTK